MKPTKIEHKDLEQLPSGSVVSCMLGDSRALFFARKVGNKFYSLDIDWNLVPLDITLKSHLNWNRFKLWWPMSNDEMNRRTIRQLWSDRKRCWVWSDNRKNVIAAQRGEDI